MIIYHFCCWSEHAVQQTIELPVIWYAKCCTLVSQSPSNVYPSWFVAPIFVIWSITSFYCKPAVFFIFIEKNNYGTEWMIPLWRVAVYIIFKSSEVILTLVLNSTSPGWNGCLLADDIFRCVFVNEKFCILIDISPKFILKGPTDNDPVLV